MKIGEGWRRGDGSLERGMQKRDNGVGGEGGGGGGGDRVGGGGRGGGARRRSEEVGGVKGGVDRGGV